MLVLKINVFSTIEKKESNSTNCNLERTFFIEVDNLSVKSFYHRTHANEKYANETFPDFVHQVTHEELELHMHEVWHINPSDDVNGFMLLGYFDAKGEFKYAAVYSSAEIYLLQNGKTIDKIVV